MKESLPDPWLRVTCLEAVIEIDNLLTNTRHLVARAKPSAEEKYPSIDSVFPKLAPSSSVCLNRDYLKLIMTALDGSSAALWVSSADKVVVIASPDGKAPPSR
jgi:hypothetical protein